MSRSRSVRRIVSSPRRSSPRARWKTNGPNRTDSAGGALGGRARRRILATRSDSSRGSNGFDEIIVGADFEAHDPVLLLVARGQHQDRHRRVGADGAREIEAVFARHHDVEDQEIEIQAFELGARLARALGGGDAIAFADKKPQQQRANAAVVVDDEQMRRVVGGVRGRRRHDGSSRPFGRARSAARDQAQHAIAVLGVDHAGEKTPRRSRGRRVRVRRAPG